MADIDSVVDEAGLTNEHVRDYVRHWAELTGADRVEVINASDDARLLQEWALAWQGLIEFEFVPVVPSQEVQELIAPLL